MRSLLIVFAAGLLVSTSAFAADKEDKVSGPLSFKLNGLDGKVVDLSTYKGKVVLLVNVASQCGYTPQYEGLQKLYEDYSKDGLVVVGVPSNDFGRQEPGSDEEIAAFCKSNYKVTFPMLSKVAVKGDAKTPLYKFLTEKETNPEFSGEVSWNFEKFLIGRDGKVVGRYKSKVTPTSDEMIKAVKTELAKK
ncbi:MAG: glutathione peroxidase [Gemmataceae bacterium]